MQLQTVWIFGLLTIFISSRWHHCDAINQTAAMRQSFGLDELDYWYWRFRWRNWRRQCDKYNNNTNAEDTVHTRIAGGNLAASNMFPYQAGLLLLQAPKVFQCGGSLISQHFVLTAAHCLYGVSLGRVFLGSNRFADNETLTYNVTRRDFIIHEKYLFGGGVDDIALIFLAQKVPLSASVQTIPLAKSFMQQSLLEGEIVTASGWGRTGDNVTMSTTLLYYVDSPVLEQQRCACFYLPGLVRARNHICIDGVGGRGSCEGDSGGPLTFFYKGTSYLVGSTVFGSAGGCEIGFPSVFMRITYYTNWIRRWAALVG